MQCPFCKEEILDGAIKCKHCLSIIYEQKEKKVTWAMEKWQAVIIAIIILIVFIFFIPLIGEIAIIILSSFWASLDAGKINAKQYQSNLMMASPRMVFFGCLLCWGIVFFWYLYFRSNIKAGNVPYAVYKSHDLNLNETYIYSGILPDMIDREKTGL